jgi:uncharacterized protein YjbI with pentapeptide repeats
MRLREPKAIPNGGAASGADLSRANLGSANLAEAELANVNLSGANLRVANMAAAVGAHADLSATQLAEADLTYAELPNAKLDGADLRRADFGHAKLSGASWAGAKLERTSLLAASGVSNADLASALGVRTERLARALVEEGIALESRSSVRKAFAKACGGGRIPGASGYPRGSFHPAIVLGANGKPSAATWAMPRSWTPAAVRFGQLVACGGHSQAAVGRGLRPVPRGRGQPELAQVLRHPLQTGQGRQARRGPDREGSGKALGHRG